MATSIFRCPHCAGVLRVPQSARVALMECGHCRQAVSPPGQPPEALTAWPARVLALELSFLCAHCENRLRIDARYENREIQCANCRQLTRVPSWSPTTKSPPPSSLGAELSAAEIEFLAAAFAHDDTR